MVVGVAGMVGDDLAADARGAARRHRPAERRAPSRIRPVDELGGAAGAHPPEGLRPGATSASASRATRSSTPTATRCSCSRTVLGTGMSSRLFLEVRERRGLAYYVYAVNQLVHRRRHAVLAGGRRPEARRRGGRRDRRGVQAHRRGAGPGRRAREGALAREGPLRPPDREPATACCCSGCAARCSKGRRSSPSELLAGLDSVTVEDVQRVAQDLIDGRALRLAVIGPFDDASKFEALL